MATEEPMVDGKFYKNGWLTSTRSVVHPEKLTCSQLVKKFPTFYGTRSFITTFTSARQLSLFSPI